MSAPTIVYRCPGMHAAHSGQTYDYAKAADDDALAARLSAGWHLSLVEAVEAALGNTDQHDLDDDAPASREELEKMATDLGLKFDGRTSDAALLRRIEEALAEKP